MYLQTARYWNSYLVQGYFFTFLFVLTIKEPLSLIKSAYRTFQAWYSYHSYFFLSPDQICELDVILNSCTSSIQLAADSIPIVDQRQWRRRDKNFVLAMRIYYPYYLLLLNCCLVWFYQSALRTPNKLSSCSQYILYWIELVSRLVYFKIGWYPPLDLHGPDVARGFHVYCLDKWYIFWSTSLTTIFRPLFHMVLYQPLMFAVTYQFSPMSNLEESWHRIIGTILALNRTGSIPIYIP